MLWLCGLVRVAGKVNSGLGEGSGGLGGTLWFCVGVVWRGDGGFGEVAGWIGKWRVDDRGYVDEYHCVNAR